ERGSRTRPNSDRPSRSVQETDCPTRRLGTGGTEPWRRYADDLISSSVAGFPAKYPASLADDSGRSARKGLGGSNPPSPPHSASPTGAFHSGFARLLHN